MQTPYVFVYGTLRAGERNDHFLANMKLVYEGARIQGELYDTGLGYPVLDLREQGSTVIGDIYKITPEKLKELDLLEGYHRNRRYNLYQRVVREVQTEDGAISCYMYVRDQLRTEREQLIPGGDWKKRHALGDIPLKLHPQWEKGISNQDFLYFVHLAERHPFVQNEIVCVPIRTGFNREGKLYATVLIQNGFDRDITLTGQNKDRVNSKGAISCQVKYVLDQTCITQLDLPYTITIPALKLMPWTFVFNHEVMQESKFVIHQAWFKGQPWQVMLELNE